MKKTFGMMGTDSITWTITPGALTFPDRIATARDMVTRLRAEGAGVIICMSHGGVRELATGPITEGDDVNLARAVPEIDVIVGGHSHTFMRTPVIANGTPVVQAGCYGQAVGELVIRFEGRDRTVVSYELHTVDDTIPGNPELTREMKVFAAEPSRIVFAPRGRRMDEPIALIDRDWSNTFFDLDASRPLGNVATDAIRDATGADLALNAAGMVRAGLTKGTSGLQTAYDVFLIAPLGIGVADQSAGGSLVRAYVTGREIKNCLEFFLPGSPNLPGQYYPRVSGVYLGLILASIPKKTNGVLALAPKRADGTPLRSRADGRWGLPELVARFSHEDMDDALVHGGAFDTTYLGLNWWASRRWKFGVGWGHTWLNRFETKVTDSVQTRIQWIHQ